MAKQAGERATDSLMEGLPGDVVCISYLLQLYCLPLNPGALWEKYCSRALLMSKRSKADIAC